MSWWLGRCVFRYEQIEQQRLPINLGVLQIPKRFDAVWHFSAAASALCFSASRSRSELDFRNDAVTIAVELLKE